MTTQYQCPSCYLALAERRHASGLAWICAGCGGTAITLAVIRQHAHADLANAIWTSARASQTPSERRCPGCGRPFKVVDVEDPNGITEVDGCVACRFFWFDGTELARLGITLKERPETTLRTPEARRAVAELQLDTLRQKRDAEELARTVRDLVSSYLRW